MRSDPESSRIALVRVAILGEFPIDLARALVVRISRRIGIGCRLDSVPLPIEIPMLEGREQADADRLLKRIETQAAANEAIVALTHLDIGHPIFTHFFGRARQNGHGALVSVARLAPEYYGLPEDHELLRRRTLLEIVHELGHVAGLLHCGDNRCLMHFAPTVEAIDNRGHNFCAECTAAVAHELRPHLSRE